LPRLSASAVKPLVRREQVALNHLKLRVF
jgi:hypothetical protein